MKKLNAGFQMGNRVHHSTNNFTHALGNILFGNSNKPKRGSAVPATPQARDYSSIYRLTQVSKTFIINTLKVSL
jgi:hypothetical protein